MRYRIAVLMLFLLFAVLPLMNVLAAPAPDPYAILEIGPPPEGWTTEQNLTNQINFITSHDMLAKVCSDPEVKKLPSVAAMGDARPWLAKNIRGTPEEGKHCLHFTFQAGKTNEKVTIINALLRVKLSVDRDFIQSHEKKLHRCEIFISKLESRNPTDNEQKRIDGLRNIEIPELRAEIARLKLTRVIKWAK